MSARVPTVIVCALVAFGIGALAGAITMVGFGKEDRPGFGLGPSPFGPGAPMPSGPGGPGGGGGGGGRAPSAKNQLATLVTKLDQLTQTPLTVQLTAEQKKKIVGLLHGLPDRDEIGDEDAKKCLDELLEVLKGNKETLEAAGFRWPGAGGGFGGGGQPPANPFKEGNPNKHLKSLETTLVKS
jgi:hypothetical protein